MKRIYWNSILGIALVHFAGTVGVFLKNVSLGMSRFDTGGPASMVETYLKVAFGILTFPIAALFLKLKCLHLPGLLGWLPFILNSLLWAGTIVGGLLVVKRKRSQNTASQPIAGTPGSG